MSKDSIASEYAGLILVLTVASVPVSIFGKVYVTRYLWDAAVEPTFHVATPSNAVLYALALLAMLWTHTIQQPNGHEPTTRESVATMLATVAAPWLVFVLAKIGFWLGS